MLKATMLFLTSFLFSVQSATYKNVALNPQDVHDSTWKKLAVKTYPHATSNSECRMDPVFFARCAINDTIKNTCHGAGCPSWGPEQVTNAYLKVDFGKNVAVDSVTLYIRADFPHDGYWYKGLLCFSDSSKVSITMDSTAKAQRYKFSKKLTKWVRLDSLKWHVPNTWCAISQLQVWGYDSVTTGIQPMQHASRVIESDNRAIKNTSEYFLINGSIIKANQQCDHGKNVCISRRKGFTNVSLQGFGLRSKNTKDW
jgi:hypothetical protein